MHCLAGVFSGLTMPDIIFVVPDEYPEYYATYTDYYKLAALSGFGLCRRSAMDTHNPAHCYIVTWFDVQSGGWQDAKARIILWNLEWTHHTPQPIEGLSATWSPDAGFAALHGWQYVPVGSHPDLVAQHEAAPRDYAYDVTLQMYRDPHRRRVVIDDLIQRGLRIAPDAWGVDRHVSLMQSRLQVHIHQHDSMNVASPLRFAVAAAYRKPILSELIDNAGIYDDILIQVSYSGIAAMTQVYLTPPFEAELRDTGEWLHQKLCIDNPFGQTVRANV